MEYLGYWACDFVPSVAAPAIFDISLPKPIVLSKYKISGANSSLYCKRFKLYGSNDGENYYEIQEVTNNTYTEHEYTTNSTEFYKYFRLEITESNSSSDLPAILEFNISAWRPEEEYNQIVLNGITLTSYEDKQRLLLDLTDKVDLEFDSNILPPFKNTMQYGYLIQSSGDYLNTSIIDAFDYDNTYTAWRSLEAQVNRYVEVSMPINVIPEIITIKLANVSNGVIEGSMNGDDWETLKQNISTADGETVETKQIELDSNVKCRYIRFRFNAKVSGTSSYIYSFEVSRGMTGNFNYSERSFININSLGNREVESESIGQSGNYELVYDGEVDMYVAYLNSFDRATVENTYTAEEKQKLAGIEVGAEVNIIDGIKLNGAEILPDANRVVNINALVPANKGVANGVASLDGSGKVPSGQLPSISVEWSAITGKPTILTTLTSSATNNDLVGAKCLYDIIGNLESLLSQI